MRVRCTTNTMNPMVHTMVTPIWGKWRCICSNVLQTFQDLSDVVTAIKTRSKCIKIMMNPAGGNIVARGKSEGPKCSGMVSTFITQISTVTVHVLYGEPKFALSENHGPLTRECQLHMRTSLDRAQANTSSMQRIKINARLLTPGHWTMRTKERQCFNHGSHFGCVVGVCSGTRESGMSLGGDDGTKHDINSSTRDREITPSSKSFTINNASTTILKIAPPRWSLHLSRVKERPLRRKEYLALGLGRRKFWCGTAGMCRARQVACYAWAYAGVMAVIKRILPFMQSPKFPGFSLPWRCLWWA